MSNVPARVRAAAVRTLLVLALAMAGTALTAVSARPHAAAAAAPTLMIYGDSITQGASGDYTWRYRLWKDLTADGAVVDFVGPADDLHALSEGADTHAYADPDFDTDHASRWGMQLGAPVYPLADMVAQFHPDVVVALLGLNDLLYGLHTPGELAQIWSDDIAAARAIEPGISVVLVQQPDVWYAGVTEYNEDLVALAEVLDTPGSRVVATGPIGSEAATDTWDNSHPTASGEIKIATAAADALARIGFGTPGVPGGIRTRARADGVVHVTWSAAPAATAYSTGVSRPGGSWTWLPPRTALGATLTGLRSGRTYQVAVRARNGPIPGASALVRVHVPRVGPVRHVTTRVRARRVTVSGRAVAYAQRYRWYVARARSCAARPATWRLRAGGLTRPHVRRVLRPGAWWVRLVAVRDGVEGTLARGSSRCIRVPAPRR